MTENHNRSNNWNLNCQGDTQGSQSKNNDNNNWNLKNNNNDNNNNWNLNPHQGDSQGSQREAEQGEAERVELGGDHRQH